MLAVTLCPGDNVSLLVNWVLELGSSDRDRIRFYTHPGVDLFTAFQRWYEHGLDNPYVHMVTDWKTLHPPFGRDLNNRVYKDVTSGVLT